MTAIAAIEWLWLYERINYPMVVRVCALTLVALVGLPALRSAILRVLAARGGSQDAVLAGKAVLYVGWALVGVTVLRELGFQLTALLGAAGVAGIAIGFASQTTLSNLISGLFLIIERSFVVGDVITVGDATGTVDSIDLLSVKLRTFDNRLIRVPNENLIKSPLTNITRFPIRRLDIDVGVAYHTDIPRAMRALAEVADRNPFSLDEPAPVVLFKGFGDSALQLMLGVWFLKADFLNLRNSIHADIKARLDAEGIEIPFPHLTVYAGTETAPMPLDVRLRTPTAAAESGPRPTAEVGTEPAAEAGTRPAAEVALDPAAASATDQK